MGRAGGGSSGGGSGHFGGGFSGGGSGRYGGGFSGGGSGRLGGSNRAGGFSGRNSSERFRGPGMGGPGMPPPRRRGFFGYRGFWGFGGPSAGGCCFLPGCGMVLILIIIVAAVISFIAVAFSSGSFFLNSGANSEIQSTVEREKLTRTSFLNDCYTDELGWISNSSALISGLRSFYENTGVVPYLYLTDNIDGDYMPSSSEVYAYASTLYDDLFTDEYHFLFVFVESAELEDSGDYFSASYVIGNEAVLVMDDEAVEIFEDYVLAYYYDDSLSDEEFFASVFSDTGAKIMTVYKSPWVKVVVIIAVAAAVIAVLLIVRSIFKKKAQRDRERAEEAEKILNTPLHKYSDSADADDLASKYDTARAQAAGEDAAKKAADDMTNTKSDSNT